MKKITVIYWIVTGLFLAVMLMSSVTSFIPNPEGEAMMKHLGVSLPLLKFLGVLKILGVIVILIPGFPRLKEWAYAGFTFDLLGAIFLGLAAGDPVQQWIFVWVTLAFVLVSYYYYHKRRGLAANRPD